MIHSEYTLGTATQPSNDQQKKELIMHSEYALETSDYSSNDQQKKGADDALRIRTGSSGSKGVPPHSDLELETSIS